MSVQKKIWVHKEIPESDVERLSKESGISRLMAKVLINRGITESESVKSFLSPRLDRLYDPFLMRDMEAAVERIARAVESNEHIVIYGDYDVDGVTATSILLDYLAYKGAKPDFYIPDRLDEGYGLSVSAADKIADAGASLVITVDCGITAVDEINHMNNSGMQVIITDHHECKDILPDAYAVIDPCRNDCSYPFNGLAGVGVAFKLVQALCIKLGDGDLFTRYLDLAALGTVADAVPLTGENRIIVKYGLKAIEKTRNKGIDALIGIGGLKGKPVNTFGVGFVLAPRVNAAGRIGSAERAVRLFTADDAQIAGKLANELDYDNRYRQETETEIIRQAVDNIGRQVDLDREKVIVVSGERWHHGITGIAASKLAEKYCRPCILISVENGMGRGSGRSREGFNLFEALTHCSGLLEKFGGHEMAAGLSIKESNIDSLRISINEFADSVLAAADLLPCIRIDAFVEMEEISKEDIEGLELLAPFGTGNPAPVFAYSGFTAGGIKTVGDSRHLKLKVSDRGADFDAIGFNMGALADSFHTDDMLDAAFTLEINEWNNIRRIQLNLKDIRLNDSMAAEYGFFSDLDKCIVFNGTNDYNINKRLLKSRYSRRLEEIIPDRSDLAAVYRHIRVQCGKIHGSSGRVVVKDLFVLARVIKSDYKVCMNYFKLKKSIEIFAELELLKIEPFGEKGMVITFCSRNGKAELDDSQLYRRLQELRDVL